MPPLQVMSPQETAAYGLQRQKVTDAYTNAIAQANLTTSQQGATFGLKRQGLTNQYAQARSALPGSFAKRGVLNSGIYGQGLQQYAQNRTNAFQNLDLQQSQTGGQAGLAQAIAARNQATGLSDVASQQAMRQQQIAQDYGLYQENQQLQQSQTAQAQQFQMDQMKQQQAFQLAQIAAQIRAAGGS